MHKVFFTSIIFLQIIISSCTKQVKEESLNLNPKADNRLLAKEEDYIKIQLTQLNSGHLSLYANLNKVKGHFILDTGASTSIIDRKNRKKFRLISKKSNKIAKTAGGIQLQMEVSHENTIEFENLILRNFKVSIVDLKHINYSFHKMGIQDIDGIIGNDILKNRKGVIDYDMLVLYLKK